MAVIVSGPVLASVLYGQADCPGDQEGLLIGQVTHSVTDTISDSQINNYKKETKIYVYSCNVIPRERSQKRRDQLLQCMTEQIQKLGDGCIVGWYRSRRNSSLRVSMMEKSTHQCLLKKLPGDKREEFYFLLCTASQSPNGSTHDFDFGFYTVSKATGGFQKVPVSVVNLGDTTHNQYKYSPSCTVSPTSGIYSSVTTDYQHELLDKSGNVAEVCKISGLALKLHSKLQVTANNSGDNETLEDTFPVIKALFVGSFFVKYVKGLTKLVLDSECRVQALEDEVRQKRQILDEKFKEEQQQLPPSPPPAYRDLTPALVPETVSSSKTSEDAVAVARQRREQRRRDAKALYPNVQPGRHTSAKSRLEAASPHTRRLSAEIDEYQTSPQEHRLGDDIAFIDEDVGNEGEKSKTNNSNNFSGNESKMSDKNTEMNRLPVSSTESGTFQQVPQAQALSKQETGEKRIPTVCSKSVPKSISLKQSHQNPAENFGNNIKNESDHFSFVSGLIAQEKTKSPPRQDPGSFSANENSVVLPVGGQMKLPPESKSVEREKLTNNKREDKKLTKSQRQQQPQAGPSGFSSQRTRTRSGQVNNQTNSSKSHDGQESSNFVGNIGYSEKSIGHKSSSNDTENETTSGNNCRFQASSERQNYDSDEDVNTKGVSEHGQLDQFCVSSSPVF